MIVHRIVILFFLLAVAGGCTIQKRTHSRGYHIEWRRRYNKPVRVKESRSITDTLSAKADEPADTLAAETDTIAAILAPEPAHDTAVVETPERDTTERKFEKIGLLSAGMLAPIFLAGLENDQVQTRELERVMGIVMICLLALMFVLGVVSMVRYLREPWKYKFNIWAIIGLLIPIVMFVAAINGAIAFF